MKSTKKAKKTLSLDAFKAKASKSSSKALFSKIVGGTLATCHVATDA